MKMQKRFGGGNPVDGQLERQDSGRSNLTRLTGGMTAGISAHNSANIAMTKLQDDKEKLFNQLQN